MSIALLHAQSIDNTGWKSFFADELNDTLTIHVHGDSSFVTNSHGEVLVRSNYTIEGETFTISDYGTGEYVCPGTKGKYKIMVTDDSLTFTLVDDPCEGRANSINGRKWIRASN